MVTEILETESTTMPALSPAMFAAEQAPRWFALYIIRKHEKQVEQQLRAKGVEVFLPLFTVSRRRKNQTTATVNEPLFPGYVFARINRTERVRVLEVPSVVSIVGNRREYLPLPDAEIETLRSAIHLRRVDPYPYLKVGNRARICRGPLAGMEGLVLRKDNRLRIVLSLDLIMRSVAVHVDADELEAA